jgi:6 kDa early secretory antigenic target
VSDVLVVNFAALQQASADIAAALHTMQAQLEDLERQAGPLVSTWDGDAKEAFAQQQAHWRHAAGELEAMLRSIRVAVDRSAAEYLDTERRNTMLFQ